MARFALPLLAIVVQGVLLSLVMLLVHRQRLLAGEDPTTCDAWLRRWWVLLWGSSAVVLTVAVLAGASLTTATAS